MDLVLKPDCSLPCLPPALAELKAALAARKAKAAARALLCAPSGAGQQREAQANQDATKPLALRPDAQETVLKPPSSASEQGSASAKLGAPKPLAPGPDAQEIVPGPPGSPSEPRAAPADQGTAKLASLRVDAPAFATKMPQPASRAAAVASKLRACAPAFQPRAPQAAPPAAPPQPAAALLDERAKWADGRQVAYNLNPVPEVRHAPLPPRPPLPPPPGSHHQFQGPMRGPQRPAMRRNSNAPAAPAASLAGRVRQGPSRGRTQGQGNLGGRARLPFEPSPSPTLTNATTRQPQLPLLRFGCAAPTPWQQCGASTATLLYPQPNTIPQPIMQQQAAQACIVRAAGGTCTREACPQCHPRMVYEPMWSGGPAPATRGAPLIHTQHALLVIQ